MTQRIVFFVVLLWFCATPVSAQYIGIFMDPSASSCAADVGEQPWVDLYVVAVLEGEQTEARGAQFQITGVPEGWNSRNVLWVPDTEVGISLGHPLFPNAIYTESGGVNVAFGPCRGPQDGGRVVIGRIVLLGAPTPASVHLEVQPVELVPPDPNCPFVNDCSLAAAKSCVGGGEIILNGPAPASCQVAVQDVTWTRIKVLFH